MAKFLGLNHLWSIRSIVKEHGGWRSAFYKLYRMDELKSGTCVGIDKDGNKFFENARFFYGRNRWVEYSPKYGMDYDGSQVPAEWYGWLHYKTDYLPYQDPHRPKYKWMAEHTENLTGFPEQYTPYSTTRPKIEAWVPPSCSTAAKK